MIEIVAALAIIGLGLVGILSLFPVGIDASKRAGDLTHATVLAQGVLNQIRSAAKRGDLSLNEAKTVFKSSPQPFDEMRNLIPVVKDEVSDYYELFQYQVEFGRPEDQKQKKKPGYKPFENLSDVQLSTVTVTVSWPSDDPIEFRNRVSLTTLIKFPR